MLVGVEVVGVVQGGHLVVFFSSPFPWDTFTGLVAYGDSLGVFYVVVLIGLLYTPPSLDNRPGEIAKC